MYWSFFTVVTCLLLLTATVKVSCVEFLDGGSGFGQIEFTNDLLDDEHADETSDPKYFANDEPKQLSNYQPKILNSGIKSSKITFPSSQENDACLSTFVAPEHSSALCSKVSKACQVTCKENYKFPKGVSKMTFVCDGTKYKVKGSLSYAIPSCIPVCNPTCKNGGTCEKPNKCSCPKHFDGPFCQHFSSPLYCNGFPNTPLNSKKKCNSDACTISCVEGYQFPDFSTVANVFCKNGSWTPGRVEWSTVPDCNPICNPLCLNGGNCIGYQKCQCPTDFRGPKCQYPESSCDVSKLNFNGNYNCSDDMEKNVCTLSCPQGSTLEPFKTPVVEYTCLFETGQYEPKYIPQCMFDNQPSPMINVVNTVVEVINTFKRRPGSCVRWGYGNYKTFDGKIYSFLSDCTYTLISDIKSNSFHVQARFDHGTISYINVYIFDNLYQIKRNIKDNIVSLSNNGKLLAIPNELVDIGVEVISGQTIFITLRTTNIKIIWKSNGILQLDSGSDLWNSTDGLCGRMDGLPENDFSHNSITSFINKWLVSEPNDICEYPKTDIPYAPKEFINTALEFCSTMNTDKFKVCSSKNLNTLAYIEACKMDYIQCVVVNGSDCGCSSIAAYAEECFEKGQMTLWRDDDLCPYRCSNGKVYSQCLPDVQETCSIMAGAKIKNNNMYCEEGCVCPFGTILNDGVCVAKEKCPCKLRNKLYQPGEEITKDCNKCTCIGGEWSCTNAKCRAECYAIGDPHYKTFDGMKFNFMGLCSYYLVVLPEFSIEAENIPCDGTMSMEHGFEISKFLGKASCTKTITIRFGNSTNIKLGQGKTVFVNGEIVEKLPISVQSVAYIREQSTFFLQILISNGIEVWWDGETRMYIHASPELEGKTRGLCGTFNGNQNDDMFTPEGDIETNVVSFANKWKTKENCVNKNLKSVLETAHPCDENIQYKHLAESYCSNITGKLFSDCHSQVDPIPYYDDCLYDVCSCRPDQFPRCYCQILASYALECSQQSKIVDWRKEVRECGIQCPAGQYYSTCGNSCQRTCQDISIINSCKSNCIEGCYCPKGLTLSESGECIPVEKCPCYYHGQKFESGQKRIEISVEEKHLCTCKSATWECRLAEKIEIAQWKDVSESSCSHQKHLIFTECEPSEPTTCRNMHDAPQSTPAICYSGCVCKKPYVLDSFTRECVLPTECPCHHGGKSYNNNETFYDGCNTCECNLGKWICTNNECPGICSVWGDSHFQTFDSRYFDFQGACEYILSKGSFSSYESFITSIEIVPCGSTGATCIKSVTLTVGSGDDVETIQLKYKQYPSNTKRITVKEVGHIFVVVEVSDLGLQIFWDKGTRLNLQVNQKWKNHVNGLCGNYNDNQMDDFQTPYGGIPEVSALLFGDSWKLQPYCSHTSKIRDACVVYPHRKQWAIQQCSILKSSIFKSCHSQVSIDNYFERCLFDTCACDQGGDCECLCTAIAAYAQECSIHGIFVKWRSQNMCPMQCENGTSYNSCIPHCSQKSCNDYEHHTTPLCEDTFCVEGCSKAHCPPGQVYINSTSDICVPKSKCKIPCKIDSIDRLFNDGDVVVEDSCHSCFCSRNRKICKGQPCPTTTSIITSTITSTSTTTTTSKSISDQTNNTNFEHSCSDGWSAWIQVNQINSKNQTKLEYLPTFEDLRSIKFNDVNNIKDKVSGICKREEMTDIQCRSSKGENKGITEKIDCSLNNGFVCSGECSDYEIRVLCKCKKGTSIEDENLSEIFDENRVINKTQIVCPDGFKWQGCKVMCNQVCHAFENQLKTMNMCVYPQKCVGGCEKEIQLSSACPIGSMWRDNNTCVSKSDCTCFSRNGTQIKPGGIFKENWCTVCQCINNAYICDDSCQYKLTTENIEVTSELSYQTTENVELTTNPYHQTTESIEITTLEEPFVTTETKIFTPEYLSTVNWPQSTTLRPLIISTTLQPDEAFSVNNIKTTTEGNIFVPSTVTPPIFLCDLSQIKPITANLGPLSYNASSWYNEATLPHFAQLYPEEINYWKPKESSENEYLQIYLGHPEIIYGVEVSGSPLNDEFVTSYKVAYSTDGISFSYVSFHGQPEIFRGPHSHDKIETQMFFTPIEALYSRLIPSTWHNSIAIRVALLGCPVSVTTLNNELYSTITPTTKSICSDPMGIESGLVRNYMVSVSSSMFENFNSFNVSLNSKTAWVPFTASSNQWIQVDFTGPRIITGVVTKGVSSIGKIGEAWTEAYKIVYSNDLIKWNKILDSSSEEKIYSANIDGQNAHTVFFDTPIRARYIRLYPEKWYNFPVLRLEVLGCFEVYATEGSIVETTIKPIIHSLNCNVCPGIKNYDCNCSSDTWWNGESCGLRSECPCVLGIMTYQVGTVYDLENCQQCTCTIGGLPDCAPKVCAPCPPGKVSTTSVSNCDCKCQSCKNGTKLCATSNVCIDESLWCNGIQDCPDDEIDCPIIITTSTTTTAIPTTTVAENITPFTTITPPKKRGQGPCPEVKCPEGQIARILNSSPLKSNSIKFARKTRSSEVIDDDPWPSPFNPMTNLAASLKRNHREPQFSTKGSVVRHRGDMTFGIKNVGIKNDENQPKCKQWICEAVVEKIQCKTPLTACPEGYFSQITPNENEICPVYTCVSNTFDESECEINGRVFKTFDGVTFKYEVCDHIIVRDRVHNKWMVKQIRHCPYIGNCQVSLFVYHLSHFIEFFPNMTTTYDGYSYTVNQLQVIGSQTTQFAVKQVQTDYIIFASTLGFNIIWQVNGQVKIKVNAYYTGRLDGLCGYFDNNPKNDKLKRDGVISTSTTDFGNSWADSVVQCEAKICPIHIQKMALEACNSFRLEPLNQCGNYENIEELVMKCIESICTCSENSANEYSECRCKAISGLVTECYISNSSVELSDWRILHDCPVSCPAPLVYKECFNKVCEPSCDSLLQNNPCPKLPGLCFPGCYCPDGLIKESGSCIKPSKCKNCVCEGSVTNQYATFDKVDFTHKQNCSHILVKTTKENDSSKPGFSIIETTGTCSNQLFTNEVCVQNLTVFQAAHKLHLYYNLDGSKIKASVDGNETKIMPFTNKWLSITESPGKSITVIIPILEIEIMFMTMNQGFSIKMPSHLYYDKTEGMCGSCNGDSMDDMAAPDGTISVNVDEFVKSWKTNETELGLCETSFTATKVKEDKCSIPKPDVDPCLKLLDSKIFGQCHAIVDVNLYLKKCHSILCQGHEGSFCHSLEAYVRECQSFGVCLDWRSPNLCPYSCPKGLFFKTCSPGCEETCDNYKSLRSGETPCNNLPTEMCVCPVGQVFNNSVCVDENRCEPCDSENHYVGDTWFVDKCTACTCIAGSKTVRCEKKQCLQPSFAICQTGFKSVKSENDSDECCEQYKCIPEENIVQNCTDIAMPVCAKDQVVKIEVASNGCKRFICECKPRDQCASVLPDRDVELLPGMVNVMNNQGCCPSFQAVCAPNTCPTPQPCPMYYDRIEIDNHSCCPQFKCELPNNTCIYEYEWIASIEGGERKRTEDEKAIDLKQVNDSWEDGPCRSCYCDMTSPRGVCNKIECTAPFISSEYVIVSKTKYGQCCPSYKKESCIFNGTIYNIGSEWSSFNPCVTMSCKLDSNDEAYMTESVKSCNAECPLGWIYMPSTVNCCGACTQKYCVMQNKTYGENDTWTYDNCTTFICSHTEFNEFNIIPAYHTCPNIGDCPKNRTYYDGCCEQCNTTGVIKGENRSLCAPESLPSIQTIGLVTEESPFHDTCTNADPINGFTECRGLCDSYTYFNKKTIKHDSKCQCCQPILFDTLSVTLQCDDGYQYNKSISVPSACSCTACGGESFSIKQI